jgi:DNA repair protein RadC
MDSEAKAGIEGIGKQINAVLSAVQESRKHSLAQELIDEGAFDVAIAYVNFLKEKVAKKEVKK